MQQHRNKFGFCATQGGFALALLFVSVGLSFAQTTPTTQQASSVDDEQEPGAPLLTGAVGFVPTVEGGRRNFALVAAPVLVIPVGEKWLVESRATFETDIQRPEIGGPLHATTDKEINFLQLDYIANKYVTVTGGRYLTPFGIFNERLYPIWIRKLQMEPLILPIEESSGTGIMLRGGIALNHRVSLNYSVNFSALSTVSRLESEREVGGRIGLFFPTQRLEIGGSLMHLLQEERRNKFGFHFEWQPPQVPLDIRSEYAHEFAGSGYWIEGAYRFSQFSKGQPYLGRTEFVGRVQQFFAGNADALADEDELPQANTKLAEVGLNYYFLDGLRATASYGRQFSSAGNSNVWTIGITYRFVIPLGRRGLR